MPFARFVVQHRDELTMPFKRFQIQPVWRADRPQKGRYREFYQCDADVVGSDSLINEIELLQIIDEVFARLGIRITIKAQQPQGIGRNSRDDRSPGKLTDITVAIDKIDKIGLDKVKEELTERGLTDDAIARLELGVLAIGGDTKIRLNALKEILAGNETGLLGVAELQTVINGAENLGMRAEVELDSSLARGLNYYT